MTREMLEQFWLLAQRWRWERLGDRFTGEYAQFRTQDILLVLSVTAFCALMVYLLYHFAPGNEERGAYESPRRLFGELCRAHRIGLTDRRLLKQLAGARNLSHPAILFVDPECFETDTLPPDLKQSAQDIHRLRERLFESMRSGAKRR
jgi:hypothetical protein